MAHWIIEDHGFGGQYYRCSECGESWCDIYDDVCGEEKCPNCGAPINEDETEYLEKSEKKEFTRNFMGKWIESGLPGLGKYIEKETKLIQVSGFDIDKLIELFAAGYTLQPPDYKSMERLLAEEAKDI